MAEEGQFGGKSRDELRKIRDEAQAIQFSLNDISKILSENASKLSKATGDSAQSFRENFNEAKKLADMVRGADAEFLKSRKNQLSLAKQIEKTENAKVKLGQKADNLRRRALVSTGKEKELLDDIGKLLKEGADNINAQAEGAKTLTNEVKKIDKKVQFFEDIAELTTQIPIIGKLFSDFGKAAKEARESAQAGESSFTTLGKALKNYAAFTGKALTAAFFGKAVQGIMAVDERTTMLQRNLRLSASEAANLNSEFTDKAPVGLTTQEMTNSLFEFNKQLGISIKLTGEEAAQLAALNKHLGLSVEQSSRLKILSAATGQNFEEYSNTLIGTALEQIALTDSALDYKSILGEAASSSAAVQISTSNQGKNLIKAAFAAKSMGLSMAQLEGTQANLLNFESSIAAEMEAELLTGKQLNLETARRHALNNNMVGLAEELTKQGITQQKFGEMNFFQQEAIAKAMGMSREEMAKSLLTSKAMKDMGAKNTSELNEQVKAQLKLINAEKDLTKRAEMREALNKKLGGDELTRQLQNQTIQEKIAETLTKISDTIGQFVGPLNRVKAIFQSVQENVGLITTAFAGIAALTGIVTIAKSFKMISSAIKGIKGFLGGGGGGALSAARKKGLSNKQIAAGFGGKLAKDALLKGGAKTAGKGLLKGAIKKIPIIGALAGLGFGISRLMDGDAIGAGLEVASGVASIFPGLGTAASVGIDVGLAARDISGASGRSAQPQNDFIMRPGQPAQPFNSGDTIVGALNPSSIGGSAEVVAAVNRLNDTWERYIRLSTNGIITSYQMQ